MNLTDLYNRAIDLAQNGKWDNDKKRCRFIRMCQIYLESPAGENVVQVGVWHGHSARMLYEICPPGKLHAVDSFAGLGEFSPEDGLERPGVREHFKANVFDVYRLIPNAQVFCGWIPLVFGGPPWDGKQFGFVAIDVDLYQPTKDSLDFFARRMVPGGVIYVDDYGYPDFPGCKTAVDESGLKGTVEDSGIWWTRF